MEINGYIVQENKLEQIMFNESNQKRKNIKKTEKELFVELKSDVKDSKRYKEVKEQIFIQHMPFAISMAQLHQRDHASPIIWHNLNRHIRRSGFVGTWLGAGHDGGSA